jgi:hypothetical protein
MWRNGNLRPQKRETVVEYFKTANLLLGILFLGGLWACTWESSSEDYLPIDDSLYSYANLPRLVIETQDFREIRNTEDYVDGEMQIYDGEAPNSEVVKLSLRGRGNSSFTAPKSAYRLKLDSKMPLLDMSANRDWVLIPNYMDKSLLRNFVTSKIALVDSLSWVPQSRFVELYVNREYQGLYQLSEKIEVSRERLNLPDDAYLVEVDYKNKVGEQVVFSKSSVPFRVHYPKEAPDSVLSKLVKRINGFEDFLKKENLAIDSLGWWIDLESYVQYYWIQELSKNVDGAFKTSVFFSWDGKGPLVMGPVWDFDAAYGAAYDTSPTGWLVRKKYWNAYLFKNKFFEQKTREYWRLHRKDYLSVVDSIVFFGQEIALAAQNNFERWPILEEGTLLNQSVKKFNSYDDATLYLQNWLRARINWIDEQIE